MKQTLNLGGKEVVVDFERLKKGDRLGDWEYRGNTTKPGNPLWSEFVNVKTGESTLKTHTLNPILTDDGHTCDGNYELVDNASNIQCKICERGMQIVWGYQTLQDGKIISHLPIQPRK